MAMVDTHGVDAHSRTDAVVAVKRMMSLASRTYGEDRPNKWKVGGVVEMAGHRQARSRWRTAAMAATMSSQCSLTLPEWLC